MKDAPQKEDARYRDLLDRIILRGVGLAVFAGLFFIRQFYTETQEFFKENKQSMAILETRAAVVDEKLRVQEKGVEDLTKTIAERGDLLSALKVKLDYLFDEAQQENEKK